MKWLTKLIYLICHIFIFILVLEICARFEDWWTWNASFGDNYSHENLFITDSLGRRGKPYGQFQKWKLNGYGFRGSEITLKKPTGKIRVIICGASETFGLYESKGKEFPAQMQQNLNSKTNQRFQIINAAAVGMTLPTNTHLYKKYLKYFKPDIIILYPSLAFYLDIRPPSIRVRNQSSPAPNDKPELRIKNKTRRQLKRFIPQKWQTYIRQLQIKRALLTHPSDWVWDTIPNERSKLFHEHLREFITSVTKDGVKVIIATHANRFGKKITDKDFDYLIAWRKFYPRASERCLLTLKPICNRIIRETSFELKFHFIDIDSLLSTDEQCFADFSHFTDRGASLVAEAMTEMILKTSIIKSQK